MSRKSPPTDALHRLLDRSPPEDYLRAWTRALSRSAFAKLEDREARSLVVRVGPQQLALRLEALEAVHADAPVRRVPGRTNALFRGLVNLRGELRLCGDLHALLKVEAMADGASPSRRIVEIAHEGRSWAFAVEEAGSVERHGLAADVESAATIELALVRYTDGMVRIRDRLVARLDVGRVVDAFEEALR